MPDNFEESFFTAIKGIAFSSEIQELLFLQKNKAKIGKNVGAKAQTWSAGKQRGWTTSLPLAHGEMLRW